MIEESKAVTRDSPDLLVIGSGTAGQTVARRCAEAGWRVAVADELPYGGTCALRGCDPKKVLVAAAEAWDWRRRMRGNGFDCREARIDWEELQRFKRSFTDPVPERVEGGLVEKGIETLHGTARFLDPDTVEVAGRRLTPGHVLIATGAEPMPLGFPGEELLTDSTELLELAALPQDLVFVGGGFISFELAHVVARAGARVRVLEMAERPLGPFDPDLVAVLSEATRALGVEVRTETRVTGIERLANGRLRLRIGGPLGEEEIEAGLVVHGAGRVPRLDPLDLAAAGVERTERGVAVDATLRSVSNARVYAAGDAAGPGPPLTPVAAMHGHVVAANLLRGIDRRPEDEVVPSVVFTLPPLARVGLDEEQAAERGLDFEVHHRRTEDWFTSRRIAEEHAAHKVLVERGSDRILGAHLLGHGAEEVVNLFALAMRAGVPAAELRRLPWAYPTQGSDVPYMI